MTALSSGIGSKSAWRDRFRTPTLEELWDGCKKQTSVLLDGVRERLIGHEGVQETVTWQGLPWRWTMVYTLPADPTRAWAYLVPDPEKPLLAVPFTEEMIQAFPMHRLKKHVRDGVLGGRKVAGVYWATWELTSKSQLTELMDLVERKRKFFTPKS